MRDFDREPTPPFPAMTDDQRALWRRLETFSFDDPDAVSLPLRARLARDNGWTLAHAGRVLDEYRRFAFLAVCAGHPVTPSDQVDQAWHLHLLYTRSYWESFCPETLRQPLHHGPTRGGASEGRKFGDWYARTLASYRRFFAQEPPADLWPPARVRFGRDLRFARVNLHDHWVLPKPVGLLTALRNLWPWAAAAGAVAVGFRVSTALARDAGWSDAAGLDPLNPLDLRGSDFLALYVTLLIVALVAALITRWMIQGATPPAAASAGSGTTLEGDRELSVLETALLVGGEPRAVATALVALERRGALAVSPAGEFVLPGDGPPLAPDVTPLERALHAGVRVIGRVATLRRLAVVRGAVADLENRLVARGLFFPERTWLAVRAWPAVIVALPLLLGLAKILVGLQRNRPVGFLVLLCGLTVGLAIVLWRTANRRTALGNAARLRLQEQHQALKATPAGVPAAGVTATAAALVLAVAIFGPGQLPGEEMRPLREAVAPPGGGGDGGGSGDSGGSDGGSCGGGGCGGCGGGGGD